MSPSTLILILDLHPLSFGLLADLPPPPPHPDRHVDKAEQENLYIAPWLDIVTIFLRAHLAHRWGNDVTVYGTSAGKARMIYPPPATTQRGRLKPRPNCFRPFQLIAEDVEQGVKAMFDEEQSRLSTGNLDGLNEPPAMVTALTKALCYINRKAPSTRDHTDSSLLADNSMTSGPDKQEFRVMIVNATPGSAIAAASGQASNDELAAGKTGMGGGYVGMMNCVFAAQKAKVPIDVLSLPPPTIDAQPPVFLQQAANLTEGVYWQWNGRGGLLQYLHSIYLTPPSLRKQPFAVPPQGACVLEYFLRAKSCLWDVQVGVSISLVKWKLFTLLVSTALLIAYRTRFPVKTIPTLRQLATFIQPIPVPDTIVPPRDLSGGKSKARTKNQTPKIAERAKTGDDKPIVLD
nr:hypothetical protein L204_00839 [Cryptococcus depauperatus CBS 7855]